MVRMDLRIVGCLSIYRGVFASFDRCEALWEIKDNEEKDSAFRGFCSLIEVNPQGIQNVRTFPYLDNAIT